MDDIIAMSQVETTMDMRIALRVRRERVDIAYKPLGVSWRQLVLLGSVELGQVPQGKRPSMSSGA